MITPMHAARLWPSTGALLARMAERQRTRGARPWSYVALLDEALRHYARDVLGLSDGEIDPPQAEGTVTS